MFLFLFRFSLSAARKKGGNNIFTVVKCHPNEDCIATGHKDGKIRLWWVLITLNIQCYVVCIFIYVCICMFLAWIYLSKSSCFREDGGFRKKKSIWCKKWYIFQPLNVKPRASICITVFTSFFAALNMYIQIKSSLTDHIFLFWQVPIKPLPTQPILK